MEKKQDIIIEQSSSQSHVQEGLVLENNMHKNSLMHDNLVHEMLQGIDAVIFDLDGSLVDSMWLWKAIDIEYLGRFGILLPEDLQTKIEGMSFRETAVYFKEHFSIPDPLEEIMDTWNRMAWDKYMYEVPLKKGIPDFLKGCRERGLLLGIATSNSRELVTNVITAHGLKDCFCCIMTGSDVERGKPSPDIYLAVARQLKTDPARCLVFEDIAAGIQAGKSAGMRVCAVEDAYSADARELKKQLADYYIEDYTDLIKNSGLSEELSQGKFIIKKDPA